jgi:hypothetical protein
MTFSVLGQKFEIPPHSLPRRNQLAGGVKAQAHEGVASVLKNHG